MIQDVLNILKHQRLVASLAAAAAALASAAPADPREGIAGPLDVGTSVAGVQCQSNPHDIANDSKQQ